MDFHDVHSISDGHGPFILYVEMEIIGVNFDLGQEIPFDWIFWRG